MSTATLKPAVVMVTALQRGQRLRAALLKLGDASQLAKAVKQIMMQVTASFSSLSVWCRIRGQLFFKSGLLACFHLPCSCSCCELLLLSIPKRLF